MWAHITLFRAAVGHQILPKLFRLRGGICNDAHRDEIGKIIEIEEIASASKLTDVIN